MHTYIRTYAPANAYVYMPILTFSVRTLVSEAARRAKDNVSWGVF